MPDFGSWATAWWKPILFVIVAGHLTNVSVTLFLHRAQTHRGVKLHYLAALPMRIWLWLSTAIVTKEWVACHRKHHAFADREGDPHSPLMEGLRNIILKGAFYYRKTVRQPGVLDKYGKGTPNDWLERHLLSPLNWVGILVMLAVDAYLFGFFVGPLVWGVQMIWIPFGRPESSMESVTPWATGTSTSRTRVGISRPLRSGSAAKSSTTTTTPIRTRPVSKRNGMSSTSAGSISGCSPSSAWQKSPTHAGRIARA